MCDVLFYIYTAFEMGHSQDR